MLFLRKDALPPGKSLKEINRKEQYCIEYCSFLNSLQLSLVGNAIVWPTFLGIVALQGLF